MLAHTSTAFIELPTHIPNVEIIWISSKRVVQLNRDDLQPDKSVRQDKDHEAMSDDAALVREHGKGHSKHKEEHECTSHLNERKRHRLADKRKSAVSMSSANVAWIPLSTAYRRQEFSNAVVSHHKAVHTGQQFVFLRDLNLLFESLLLRVQSLGE
jgi:hypothetical protein